MANMANAEIRKRMKKNNVKQWEIAGALGVCEMTITRWLRYELTGDRLKQVNLAIDQIICAKSEAHG